MIITFRIENGNGTLPPKAAIVTPDQLASLRDLLAEQAVRLGMTMLLPIHGVTGDPGFELEARICPLALAVVSKCFDHDPDVIAVLEEAQFLGRRVRIWQALPSRDFRIRLSLTPDDAPQLAMSEAHAMTLLYGLADDINPHDPHSRMISVAEWETCEPSSIPFVSNAGFARPVSRVLRKRLQKGLGLFSKTAEIVFNATMDDYDENPAVQLELGLPGTKFRELVIDLSDDFDPPPAKQLAEVIAFPRAVETPDNSPSPAAKKGEDDRSTVVPSIEVPDDLDAAVFGITASSPTELAANVLDAPAPCLVESDDANRRTLVRRKQVMLLTTMTAIMLLLSMQWIFTGDDHYHSHATSAVSEGDLSPGPSSEQEWAAQTDDRLEEGNAQ